MSKNPYASSTVDPTSPPTGGLWRVEGKFLLVRDGAILPPGVPLFGNGEKGLVQETRVVRLYPVWMRLFAFLPAISFSLTHYVSPLWCILITSAFAGFCYLLHRYTSPSARLVYACDLRRSQQRRWAKVTLCVYGPMLVWYLLVPVHRSDTWLFQIFGALVLLGVLYIILYARNVPSCVKQKDGWLYLKGMNAQALQRLDEYEVGSAPLQADGRNGIED